MATLEWLDGAADTLALVRAAGGVVTEVERDGPAAETEVEGVEATLGAELPAALRQLFTEGARRFSFSWHLGSVRPTQPSLRELSEGAVDLDLDQLVELEESREEWAGSAEERVADLTEMRGHGNAADEAEEADAIRAAAVWRGKFPFCAQAMAICWR